MTFLNGDNMKTFGFRGRFDVHIDAETEEEAFEIFKKALAYDICEIDNIRIEQEW